MANHKLKERGVTLYLAIVILSVLTTAVLALADIVTTQIRVIFTAGQSVKAFYAADAGMEQALQDRDNPAPSFSGWLDLNNNSIRETNQDSFFDVSSKPKGGECKADNFCIVSTGRFRNIKRAIITEY